MPLAERVTVARRFQRAIRIDTDVGDPLALEGFVCTKSSASVLETMAQHLFEAGHSAFTWTGPYGSGKSSLVVALSALLGPDADARREAASIVGEETATSVWEAMPPKRDGWRVLPIVGRRDRPERLVEEAIRTRKLGRPRRDTWSESRPWTLCGESLHGTRTPPEASLFSSTKWAKSLRPQPGTVPMSTSSSNWRKWLLAAMAA